jgi:hypothetical protein
VSNAKNDGSEERKYSRRAEVVERNGHCADLHKEVLADA